MKITRNKKKIPEQNSLINKNIVQTNILINLDYSIQSLYEILIKNPFLVNEKDKKGETFLSYAIERDKNEIFDLILTSPVLDLNYQNKEGNSYLHLAVQFEREEMVSKLIKKGIFLNFQNNDGNTALHFAHLIGNKNIINLLNNNNIDFTIKNNLGKIAEQESEKNDNKSQNNSVIFNDNIININDNDNDNKFNIGNDYIKNNNPLSCELNKTIKIKWSDDDIIKKNRKLNLNLSNNLNSNNNQLKSYQIYRKNRNNFKSKSILDSSIKINKKLSIHLDEDDDLYSLTSSIENQRKSNLVKIKNFSSTTQTNTNYNNNQTNKITEEDDIVNINQFNNEKNVNLNKKNNTSILFKSKNNSLINNIIDLNIDKNINIERLNYQKMFSDTNSTVKTTKPKIEINDDFGFSSPYIEIPQQITNQNNNNQIYNNQNIFNENLISQKNIIKDINNQNIIKDNFNQNNLNNNDQNNLIDNNNKNNLIDNNNKNIYNNNINKNILSRNNNNQNDYNENNNNQNNFNATETKLKLSLPDIRNIQYLNVINNPVPLPTNNNNNYNSNSKNEIYISSQETISSNSLIDFLESINLKKYYKNLSLNGFDDLNLIIEQTKENTLGITNENLKEAGIINPGDRAKIIIKVQELANNFSFNIPKEVYYTCSDIKNADKDKNIIKLNKWLKSINVENLLNNFISNGYHSLELLLIEINCKEPITNQKLRDELNIDKVGFRQRIIIKLSDDSKKFINQLKKNILIIDQKKTNEICNECFIF